MKMIPRHEFGNLEKAHDKGIKLRKINRWTQFVSMIFLQIGKRNSLRDLIENMKIQKNKLYHLGSKIPSRSTLSRTNDRMSYAMYEEMFIKLYSKCQQHTPRHTFRFKNKLYSIDSSTIDLCLSVFDWAKFRKAKGAIKLHIGLDHDGYLPEFVNITDGKQHDSKIAKTFQLPTGSIGVFDKAYNDYEWFKNLGKNGIFFVTRQKSNAIYRVKQRNAVNKNKGLTADQIIEVTTSIKTKEKMSLRRVGYKDIETGKKYYFLTNIFHLSAKTICDIYKERWQIELFFKWLKQNLKIKTFVGTSKNAVLTQIWIALSVYLILTWLKFMEKIQLSMQKMIQLLQINLFTKINLGTLFDPPDETLGDSKLQLSFI
jgi:putative transposase